MHIFYNYNIIFLMNYRECYSRVLYLANKSNSKTVIENDSCKDSVDVYERIFLSCSNDVFIFARGIKTEILDQIKVINAVQIFLEKQNAKLNLILRINDESDYHENMKSDFCNVISNFKNKINIQFFSINKKDSEFLDTIGSVTIGDDKMYRYRYKQGQEAYDHNSNAKVCFNDKKKCASFKKEITTPLTSKKIEASWVFPVKAK